MDLIPNGINLFLWLRSDCLVSTTQITLESVIHIRFRFWLLVCCFYNLWSNADFFFFWMQPETEEECDCIRDQWNFRRHSGLKLGRIVLRQEAQRKTYAAVKICGHDEISGCRSTELFHSAIRQLPSPTPHQTLLCTEAAAAASQRAITVGCIPLLSTLLLHILPNKKTTTHKICSLACPCVLQMEPQLSINRL